jgi:tryptophan-rich hypothetical protein
VSHDPRESIPVGRAPNPLSPRKLLHTKWTSAAPTRREKHFLVIRLVAPEPADAPVVHVEIEAVHSQRTRIIAWRELRDPAIWRQGWV